MKDDDGNAEQAPDADRGEGPSAVIIEFPRGQSRLTSRVARWWGRLRRRRSTPASSHPANGLRVYRGGPVPGATKRVPPRSTEATAREL